ncbi:ChrR family anti-sigma-E factor [Agaribacterium haliotis]|uniref:ChrR family anti-sigma-E factor n=1 Tax=Agaribacterium haliotis TaxID=2013869 RepID=UPI000BB5963C|nr:ChrR family anti-sigma-E factor [Agaribacterium haliotis]
MIKHHPDDSILLEYSAGSLDPGIAIGVTAHLNYCQSCRAKVSQFNQVGAALFDEAALTQQAPEPTAQNQSVAGAASDENTAFAALMGRIHQQQQQKQHGQHEQQQQMSASAAPAAPQKKSSGEFPRIVDKLLQKTGKLQWQRITPSLKQARLLSGQNKFEVCLHQIRRGGKVPEHDHRGREATVVLRGMFSDELGCYNVGDFVWREPGQSHKPAAAHDQDCLCLSMVEAPVQLNGLLGKIINPLLKVKPA